MTTKVDEKDDNDARKNTDNYLSVPKSEQSTIKKTTPVNDDFEGERNQKKLKINLKERIEEFVKLHIPQLKIPLVDLLAKINSMQEKIKEINILVSVGVYLKSFEVDDCGITLEQLLAASNLSISEFLFSLQLVDPEKCEKLDKESENHTHRFNQLQALLDGESAEKKEFLWMLFLCLSSTSIF
ncbi:hypothetical protein O9G_001228 [Rozella allomycis CSF55]|uniref:Uncharacterized protein n=1 Tax=Rozella allomycis (strain CSF55) TaxID=988480 RepID=A0A075AXN2_ROZAC|nr:hypothetical protein O9G_001228 [Rozella allomycis CSF55]|eukprot:EPZ33477.1 hypothetical protein O9G_001228 [Rozella allomycis CSF55]